MQHLLRPNRAYWNRGAYWDEGAYAIGTLIRIGALINKKRKIRGRALIREGALNHYGIAVLRRRSEREAIRHKRRFWIRDIFKKREEFGT